MEGKEEKLVPIGKAAEFLEVSIDTIRRWDEKGLINSIRPDGNVRYFSVSELEKLKYSKPLSISEAAKRLEVSESTLRRLESDGIILPERNRSGDRIYTKEILEKFLRSSYYLRRRQVEGKVLGLNKTAPGLDRYDQIQADNLVLNNQVFDDQKAIRKLKNFRHSVFATGAYSFAAVAILTVIFCFSFMFSPIETAKWFGFSDQSAVAIAESSGGQASGKVLGAQYSPKSESLLTKILRPIGGLCLGIIRYLDPVAYNLAVPSLALRDAGKIFEVNSEGRIEPKYDLTFKDSSFLVLPDKNQITNLNAEYVGGKKPGTEIGDLAYIDANHSIAGLSLDGSSITSGAISQLVLPKITEKNKVSGSAVQLKLGGGLEDKNGLSLKTSCEANQILVWTGSIWECQYGSGNISANGPLSYDTASHVLNLNYDSSKWDAAFNHLSDFVNPHNVTANQVLPSQTGNDNKVLATNGSSVSWVLNSAVVSWGAVSGTLNDQTDLVAALSGKENAFGGGTANDYLRGDKSWQTLNSTAVGLGNVNNTSDLNKPISNAAQTALDLKANKAITINGHDLSVNIVVTKGDIGLDNLDNSQQLPLSYLDTDGTLAANSDSKVASEKATKTYADTKEPVLTKGNMTGSGAISVSATRQVIGGAVAISITNAGADGTTKGAAAFTTNDFDSALGVISIDYTNGQTADSTHKGFLTSVDWSTFNSKQNALGFTAVPNTRTINGYALSSNINLNNSDIGLGNVSDLTQLPLSYLDTDGTLAANSDSKVASEKATKTYADTKEDAISSSTSLKYFRGDKTWQTLDTSAVAENGGLYFTNARVDSRVQGQNYAITGSWTFNSYAPQSSVAPVNSNDLTNKAYVDDIASGIIPQEPVIDFFDPTSGLPGSPTSGDRHIAEATANGWTINRIYEYNGATWDESTPSTGWAVYVTDLSANYGYNGSSWVLTSNSPQHNNLTGLQGGTTNQYYHLTSAQYVIVGNTSGTNSGDESQSTIKTKLGAASSGVDGYISGADWTTFNGKQDALGFTAVSNATTVNGHALSGNVSLVLASSDFANQGTTTTVLHGNASGNPSWSAIVTNDIANNNITYAKIQQIAANSILGNNTGSAANAIELTGSQVKAMLALVKSDVGLGNVENTALSSWTGSELLTILGTIATGTWNGTIIGETYGGTNQSAYTLGDLLYSSAANTLARLSGNATTTKKFLRQTGDGVNSAAPAWDTVTASDVGLGNVTNAAQVTSVSGTSPIQSSGGTAPAISILDAVADGSTKGAASFTAADFNSSSGSISIDYTNGQAADSTHKGFLTSTDWGTFNAKQAAGNYITALTGEVTASGPGSVTATIASDAVDFSQMQNINSQIILGRNTASSGDIEALSATTVKTILSLSNVENTALSTWVGTTNITTIGIASATRLGVGVAADATAILYAKGSTNLNTVSLLERTTTLTDSLNSSLRVLTTSTGDMADGFGSGIVFNIQDTAGVQNLIGSIGFVRAGADNTGDFIVRTVTGGGAQTEKFRITSAGEASLSSGNFTVGSDYGYKIGTSTILRSSSHGLYLDAGSGVGATSGGQNIGVGFQSLNDNVDGGQNTAIGNQAMSNGDTGSLNTAVGLLSLAFVEGDSNTGIGAESGWTTVNANYGTFIGAESGPASDVDNAIAIGYQARVTKSNQAVLGNDSIVETLLKGNVGIDVTGPTDKLAVNGSILGTSFKIGANTLDTTEWSYLDGIGGYVYRAGGTDVPIADGGTGTSNGSITGTTALAFTAGDHSALSLNGGDSEADGTAGGGVSINGGLGRAAGDAGGAIGLYAAATNTRTMRVYVDPAGGVGFGNAFNTLPVYNNRGVDVRASLGGYLTLSRNDTSVTANDVLGQIDFWSNDGSTSTNHSAASIQAIAKSTIASDINPGILIFSTTPATVGASLTEALRLDETQAATFASTVQAAGFKSSDGTAGASVSCAANKGIKSVTIKNGLITAATCTTNDLTDLAENYGTNDPSITMGDIVAASSKIDAYSTNTEAGVASKAYIEKASSTNATSVIGIVSENPEITLGENLFSSSENPRQVALSGRVKVKASNVNGSIKKGDLLTVSSSPGVAAKATEDSVVIIGTALEDFDSSSGRLIAFVNISHKLGSTQIVQLASAGALKVDTLTVEGDALFNGVIRGNDKFAGKVMLPAGQTEIRVERSWDNEPLSIVVTPSFSTKAWTETVDKTGFTIKVDSASEVEQSISWIAIFK